MQTLSDTASETTPAAAPEPAAATILRCGIRLTAADGTTIPLLLPADRPAELLRGATLCLVPNVQHWFAGLANLRGELVPVFDLLAHQQLAAKRPARRADLLVIGTDAAAFALPVQREPEVLQITASTASTATPLLGARIGSAWQGTDTLWYDFDFDSWLAELAAGGGHAAPH